MGWSCTREQSETLDIIRLLERAQKGYLPGTPGAFFTDGPKNHRDYGEPPNVTMGLPIYEMLPNKRAQRIGYIRIGRFGNVVSIPKKAKHVFGSARYMLEAKHSLDQQVTLDTRIWDH